MDGRISCLAIAIGLAVLSGKIFVYQLRSHRSHKLTRTSILDNFAVVVISLDSHNHVRNSAVVRSGIGALGQMILDRQCSHLLLPRRRHR